MLNDYSASTTTILGNYIQGREFVDNTRICYEMGGVGISNSSTGMLVQLWKGEVRDNRDIYISAPNTPLTYIVSGGFEVTQISISFDVLMHPFIAFQDGPWARLYYYNSAIAGPDILTLPSGSESPKVILDYKYPYDNAQADVMLYYVRAGNLYARVQRDRYLVEYLVKAGVQGTLLNVGLTDKARMQFMFGIRMTDDEVLKELEKGSEIASSTIVSSDPSTTPSASDIWELERKD